MSRFFLLLLTILIGGLLVSMLAQERRRKRVLRLRVKKLLASPLFAELKPILKRAQKYPIESLQVDERGLLLQYVFPRGAVTRFDAAARGFAPLTPEKQEAMVLLLDSVLPKLSDRQRYALRCKRRSLPNGQYELYYQYTIRSGYKTMLTRAPYYDGSLQSQPW